jgi:hypothetical protein
MSSHVWASMHVVSCHVSASMHDMLCHACACIHACHAMSCHVYACMRACVHALMVQERSKMCGRLGKNRGQGERERDQRGGRASSEEEGGEGEGAGGGGGAMPITPSHTWHQSESWLSIHVALRSVSPPNIDILSNNPISLLSLSPFLSALVSTQRNAAQA